MKKPLLSYFFWVLILFQSTSCLRVALNTIKSDISLQIYREEAELGSTSHDWNSVKGLNSLIASHDTVNIFMVHGMRRKALGHYDPLMEAILKESLIDPKDDLISFRLIETPPGSPVVDSTSFQEIKERHESANYVTEYTYKKTELNGDLKFVKIYNVFWSEITNRAKDSLSQYNHDEYRTRLADHIKEYYLIDAIADLALYQNDAYKNLILDLIGKVVDRLGSETQSPIVLVGGSLGSQILMDYLTEAEDGKKDMVDNIKRNISHIYLLSNQLPFSTLFYTDPQFEFAEEALAKRVYSIFSSLAEKNNIQLVNFFDPSDVLGFRLPVDPEFIPSGLTVHNVTVHNTLAWRMNPHELKRRYLAQIKDNNILNFSNNLLDLDTNRQNIRLNINQLNEGAIANPDIAEFIAHGSLKSSISSDKRAMSLDTIQISTERPKPPLSYRSKYPRLAKENTFGYIKGYGLLRAISLNKLIKRIDKLDITPSTHPFELPEDDSSIDYAGIQESIEKNDVTRILTIHGMRFKPPEHFDYMAKEIAKKLSFDPIPKISTKNLPLTKQTSIIEPHSALRFLEFKNSQNKKLQFIIVYWAPLTKPVKDFIRDYDKLGVKSDRAIGPRLLKEEIILGGIADVGIGLRGYREEIYRTLDVAFSHLMQPDLPDLRSLPPRFQLEGKNVFFITGSLGSKLMYDYLGKRLQNPSDVVL